MLDKNSVKVLRFLAAHPNETFTEYQLGKQGLLVPYPTMVRLYEKKYVVRWETDDVILSEWDEPDYTYKIAPDGVAVLEERAKAFWAEFRAWGTLVIAAAAFVKSFFF